MVLGAPLHDICPTHRGLPGAAVYTHSALSLRKCLLDCKQYNQTNLRGKKVSCLLLVVVVVVF